MFKLSKINARRYTSWFKLIQEFSLGMLLLACLSSAHAQILYDSLTGTVTDASGAALGGAKVQAVNTGTGVTQETTSDGTSGYIVLQLSWRANIT